MIEGWPEKIQAAQEISCYTVNLSSAVSNQLKTFCAHLRTRQWRSAFVCLRVLRIPALLARNARVVTTNPLDFVSAIRSIAVCICDAAIGAKTANAMPTGRWWRFAEPIEAPGNVS